MILKEEYYIPKEYVVGRYFNLSWNMDCGFKPHKLVKLVGNTATILINNKECEFPKSCLRQTIGFALKQFKE